MSGQRRGLSQAEQADLQIGRAFRRLPDELREITAMVTTALLEFEPTRCGQCGGALERVRTACAELDRKTERMTVMYLHPACSAAHDPTWHEVAPVN